MNSINKSITEINSIIDKQQTKIQQYKDEISNNKLLEIKYNNLKREMNEKAEFYENKIAVLVNENTDLKDHVLIVKGNMLLNDNNGYALKSIVVSLVDELGIDKVSSIVNIDGDKIKEYIN